MTFQDSGDPKSIWQQHAEEQRRGKLIFGSIVLMIGIFFLMKKMGFVFPFWFFNWKMLLIAVGLGIGFKHSFRNAGWLAPILVGGIFLAADLFPVFAIKPLLWPIAIIATGLFILFKPRNRSWKHHRYFRHYRKWLHDHEHYSANHQRTYYDKGINNKEASTSQDEYLEATSIMGGISKNVINKNFRGGEITTIMGSTEINLSQADFEGTISLSITQIMGGTKLIVPAHWTIRSEFTSVIASIEDQRVTQTGVTADPGKVLLLEGTSVMGGIEINSYH